MKPRIRVEELNAVLEYLSQHGGIPVVTNVYDKYTTNETNLVFPAIRKVIQYGANKHPGTMGYQDQSYKYMADFIVENDAYARTLASQAHVNIRNLITNYQSDLKAERKHELFQKRIQDMTGYEIEEFLRELGLV